jgi:nitroreductase
LALAENFFEIVKKRRSVRKYKQREISTEHLKKILEAARLAPSARNAQPWRFIVVNDQKMKEFLAEAVGDQGFLADANVVIVVLGDPDVAPYWFVRDPMIAAEHMILAATALGYGTCWIGALADYVPENMDDVKKRLNIPEKITVVCLVTIGVPDEEPMARPRKNLQEICFSELYGETLKLS